MDNSLTAGMLQYTVDSWFEKGLVVTAIHCDPTTRREIVQCFPPELRSVDPKTGVLHLGDIPVTVETRTKRHLSLEFQVEPSFNPRMLLVP